MIFLLDNYDSFTYNLYQYLGELNMHTVVRRHDQITTSELLALNPQAVIISPGPGRPEEAGISIPLVKKCAEKRIPFLGVCLGHQSLAVAFGAEVVLAKKMMHGKTSEISHDGRTIFSQLPSPLTVMRYHSLIVSPQSIPTDFDVSSHQIENDEVMAIRHKTLPLEGVQFHPESIMTEHGKALLKNFIQYYIGENHDS